MSAESIYLLCVIAAALASFYRGWVRTDVTALLVMLALMMPWRPSESGALLPILAPHEAFRGFGSQALVMVAAMFVLSAAMVRTGAARLLGGAVVAAGARSELALQMTLLVVVTLFSAFVNDTTTVLVWMPILLTVCRHRGHAPSRVLLLLGYASLLGGQWTLIGTRSNIVVSDYLRERTGEGLGFFAFTPVAACVWVAVLAYIFLWGRRALPAGKTDSSLAERYDVTEFLTEVMTTAGSELVGATIAELDFPGKHDVSLLQVIRNEEHLPPSPWLRIAAGDVLVVQARISKIARLLGQPGMELKEELTIGDKTLRSVDLRMVEALVAPNSDLIGRSLDAMDFRRIYGLSVLAVGRHGRPLTGSPTAHKLHFGDSLLLVGHAAEIARLRRNPNLLLLESRHLPPFGIGKAALSLALLGFVAASAASGLLEPGFAVVLAAVLAILCRLVGIREAYESFDLQALVVVGAMIPYGFALEKTGTAHDLAMWVTGSFASLGPHALLAALLLLTLLVTQVIENAAAAIILAPVGYELALSSGANPMPFLLGVAICTSAAFMTPVAHESTLLVMGPGGYRFRDYLRLGTPLAVITWLVTVAVLPWLYPLVP